MFETFGKWGAEMQKGKVTGDPIDDATRELDSYFVLKADKKRTRRDRKPMMDFELVRSTVEALGVKPQSLEDCKRISKQLKTYRFNTIAKAYDISWRKKKAGTTGGS